MAIIFPSSLLSTSTFRDQGLGERVRNRVKGLGFGVPEHRMCKEGLLEP